MLFLCLFCPYRHSHLASYKPLLSAALPPAVAETQPIDFLCTAFLPKMFVVARKFLVLLMRG
jgi:hypothetical protein